ncbi:hypothetical protein [uncultured Akkermansia sp.]|uniref:hypothetical protein n=1 Tax=uncultured Akkermansia sp. TaxID=512294 RepID=UPI00262F6BAF|nr:hypothetical protein [uncultured Akkermansia sp.]
MKKHSCFNSFFRFLRWRGPQERRAALFWWEGAREPVFPWPHEVLAFALGIAGSEGCGCMEDL